MATTQLCNDTCNSTAIKQQLWEGFECIRKVLNDGLKNGTATEATTVTNAPPLYKPNTSLPHSSTIQPASSSTQSGLGGERTDDMDSDWANFRIYYIAGGCGGIALIVLALLVACLIYWMRNRRKRSENEKRMSTISNTKENPCYGSKLENGRVGYFPMKELSEDVNKNDEMRQSANDVSYDTVNNIKGQENARSDPYEPKVTNDSDKVEIINETTQRESKVVTVKTLETVSQVYTYTTPNKVNAVGDHEPERTEAIDNDQTYDTAEEEDKRENVEGGDDRTYDSAENYTEPLEPKRSKSEDSDSGDELYNETFANGRHKQQNNKTVHVHVYDTFEDVKKLQRQLKGDTEEQYDVVQRGKKASIKRPDVEGYSDFDSVKKTIASSEGSGDESEKDGYDSTVDLYNKLNEVHKQKRQAPIEDYNHVQASGKVVVVDEIGSKGGSTKDTHPHRDMASERRRMFRDTNRDFNVSDQSADTNDNGPMSPKMPTVIITGASTESKIDMEGVSTRIEEPSSPKIVIDDEEEYAFCEIDETENTEQAPTEDIYDECMPVDEDIENTEQTVKTIRHDNENVIDENEGEMKKTSAVYEDVSDCDNNSVKTTADKEDEHKKQIDEDDIYDDVTENELEPCEVGTKEEREAIPEDTNNRDWEKCDAPNDGVGKKKGKGRGKNKDNKEVKLKKTSVRRKEDYEEFSLK